MKFNLTQTEKYQPNSQSGQIAVVILLVVVVMATLGLSELGQTTEDIFVSSQKEEATRVFNAAETGVEEALSDEGNFAGTGENEVTGIEFPDGLDADVTVTSNPTFRTRVNEGETATVDLTGAISNYSVRFGTDFSRSCSTASLMAAVYSTSQPTRYFYVKPQACSTPDSHANRHLDQFQAATAINSGGLYNQLQIAGADGDQLLRITPLYASAEIEVTGLNPNTVQSHTVRSAARLTDQPENTIERIIEVERSMPAAPSYMNYVLYSDGAIQHTP